MSADVHTRDAKQQQPTDAPNQNDRNHLELITNRVLENLKNVQVRRSVLLQRVEMAPALTAAACCVGIELGSTVCANVHASVPGDHQ